MKLMIGGAMRGCVLRGGDHVDRFGDGAISDLVASWAASAATSGSIVRRAAINSSGEDRRPRTAAVRRAVGARLVGDEGAGADAHFDQPGDFQRDHGLAHGRRLTPSTLARSRSGGSRSPA